MGTPLSGAIRDNMKVLLFHRFSKIYASCLLKIKMGLAFQFLIWKC